MTFPYHPWPLSMSFASCFADEFLFLFVNMCWVFSLSSMISKSHYSFYLLSFLSLSPIQAHKYLFFFLLFQALSLVDFSLSFCSFPSNWSPNEFNPPNRRTKTNGFIRPFNWQRVRICSPDLSESSNDLTPNPIRPTLGKPYSMGPPKIQSIQFREKMREKKELYCRGQFWPPFTQHLFFFLFFLCVVVAPILFQLTLTFCFPSLSKL